MKFLGGLDTMIINHANIGYMKMWYGTQDNLDLFDNSMDVNLNSYVHLASHALPHLMKSEQGRLGVMGSVAGEQPLSIPHFYSSLDFSYFCQNKDYLRIDLLLGYILQICTYEVHIDSTK